MVVTYNRIIVSVSLRSYTSLNKFLKNIKGTLIALFPSPYGVIQVLMLNKLQLNITEERVSISLRSYTSLNDRTRNLLLRSVIVSVSLRSYTSLNIVNIMRIILVTNLFPSPYGVIQVLILSFLGCINKWFYYYFSFKFYFFYFFCTFLFLN